MLRTVYAAFRIGAFPVGSVSRQASDGKLEDSTMLLYGRRIFAGGAALLVLGWLLSPFPAKTAESAEDGNRDGGSRPAAGASVPLRDAIETLHIDPVRASCRADHSRHALAVQGGGWRGL